MKLPGKYLAQKAHNLYTRLDHICGGYLSVVACAIQSFIRERAPQAAAAIAFFAFFSLFPLLLVLVAIGGYFLESEEIYQQVLTLITRAFPISQHLIDQNLERLLEKRNTIGLVGILSLTWSASAVFNMLIYNVNLAWPVSQRRGIVQNQLIALASIGILAGLLALSFVLNTLIKLLPRLPEPLANINPLYTDWLWTLLSNLAPLFVIFLLLTGLYRWTPHTYVHWKPALVSALVGTIGWQIAVSVFTWYLSSGLARYAMVYGSLGAVVALLLLIYIINWIVLFCAYLCATLNNGVKEHTQYVPER